MRGPNRRTLKAVVSAVIIGSLLIANWRVHFESFANKPEVNRPGPFDTPEFRRRIARSNAWARKYAQLTTEAGLMKAEDTVRSLLREKARATSVDYHEEMSLFGHPELSELLDEIDWLIAKRRYVQ